MKTIKIPYIGTIDNLLDYRKQFSNVVRYSYNRFIDNQSKKDIRNDVKLLNNIELMNSWLLYCAVDEAERLYKIGENIIFGGKSNFIQRLKNKITKEQFQEKRLMKLYSIGEKNAFGNRFFRLDLKHDSVVFQPDRYNRISLSIPKLKSKLYKELYKLEELQNEKLIPITYQLDDKYIYITYDYLELKPIKDLKQNRVLGIDLNPNNIGVSILDFKDDKYEVIKAINYDISKLTVKSGKSSQDKESVYLTNKLKHETIEITNNIIDLCKSYHVGNIIVEQLDIPNNDRGLGINFNRLVNNKWLKNLFQQQLEKRCKMFGINFKKVLPYYTSYIGNLQHDYIDAVNSSIEIARRGYETLVIKQKNRFYPEFKLKESLIHRWKEKVELDSIKDWKELFGVIKNLKLKYRVSLNEIVYLIRVFSLTNLKSRVQVMDFSGKEIVNICQELK